MSVRRATSLFVIAVVTHWIPLVARAQVSAPSGPGAMPRGASPAPAVAPAVLDAIGLRGALEEIRQHAAAGDSDSATVLKLRQQVLERVLMASFQVDQTLARIDAEASHAADSRGVLESQRERRDTELNIATFVTGGALGALGSAMQLTSGLDRAGQAVGIGAGVATIGLSVAELRNHGSRRVFRSPYNMLAEVLNGQPNELSQYPALVVAYLHAPEDEDGQLPDNEPPAISLANAWHRLGRLQENGHGQGASLRSVTTSPAEGQKLTIDELSDREAMLRDLHGSVALLKRDLSTVLVEMDEAGQ